MNKDINKTKQVAIYLSNILFYFIFSSHKHDAITAVEED